MIESMADIVAGKSYACKFRVETMLDINEDPAPNLNQAALAGLGVYEGFGVVLQRDTTQEVVLIKCEDTRKEFVVEWTDCWDIDDVEWIEPLQTEENSLDGT